MNELNFSRWNPPESPVVIDYSLDVLEDIRALAAEGFHRLSRGGIEVGGVLFGAREEKNVRILAMRQVNCSYARGPSYVLSEGDKLHFVRIIESHRSELALEGLTPVGFFVSHTRSQVALTESDRELFADFFPQPWQVALILRPGRMGATRAGFFVRGEDGVLQAEGSPLEFNLDAMRQPVAAPEVAVATAPKPVVPATRWEVARPAEVPLELPRFLMDARPSHSRRWRWLVLWGVAVIGGGLALRAYMITPAAEPLALQASELDGEMRLVWNPHAGAVNNAQRAMLEITDQNATRVVHLPLDQLRAGAFPFIRRGSDVNVRLVIDQQGGKKVEEVTRYLGQPVSRPPSAEAIAIQSERNRLEEENSQLKIDLRSEKARGQQLEKRVSTLENLLRIERNRSEVFKRP